MRTLNTELTSDRKARLIIVPLCITMSMHTRGILIGVVLQE